VTPFIRRRDDLVAVFERPEVDILTQLATDVQALLADADQVDPLSPSSRALGRLLPAAYRDDGENDAEFRRFTAESLIDRKTRNAQAVLETLGHGDPSERTLSVILDAGGAQAWLRCLTDIRLTIAAGLGLEHDGDEQKVDRHDRFALEVYGWVGFVQETLLGALESNFS
jgi:hypothetical protein